MPPKTFGALLALLLATNAVIPLASRQSVSGQEPPRTGLLSSRGIAINEVTGKVYAVNPTRSGLTVFDPARHISTDVPTGRGPVSLAVDPNRNEIYVANNEAATVTILDGKSDSVIADLKVGALPYILASNPATAKVFVSNTFSDTISVIDSATRAITTIKGGSADAIAMDTRRDRIYLLGYESTSLAVLSSKPEIAGHIITGLHLWGMALNDDTGALYITQSGASSLLLLDASSGKTESVKVGQVPCAVAAQPKSGRIYVANYADNTVSVVDEKRKRAIATVPVGNLPRAIAVDVSRNLIYVANSHSDSVSVVDGKSNQVVKTIPVGKNPYALVVNSKTGALYAALPSDPPLAVLDTR